MKVSIITVCFNSADTIRDTLDSVLGQTYSDIEYIVIDGGSTDGTQNIIQSYEHRLTIYISEPDKNLYDAMNKGIARAKGDIIGTLNADDVYMHSNVIHSVVEAFPLDAEILFGNLVFSLAGGTERMVRFVSGGFFRPWKLRFGWMPPHPATFIRRHIFDEIGPYRTDFRIAADYEFMIRALYVKRLAYYWVDEVLVSMRPGGISNRSASSALLLKQETVRACRENGIYTNLVMLSVKIPFRFWEYCRSRLHLIWGE